MNSAQQGMLYAISAYLLWALAPVYFKFLAAIDAFDILAHRIFWSFLFTVMALCLLRKLPQLKAVLSNKQTLAGLLLSTALIGCNWGLFIWTVHNDRILSASLGYYINPLISILLGAWVLNERLDWVRGGATLMCVAAVVFELLTFGRLPLVALGLALSFAFYGLVRKKIAVDSWLGMAVECGLLLPMALIYLAVFADFPDIREPDGRQQWWLLILSGPVAMVPMLCFVAAANRIHLTLLGFFQYIAPTGMMLIAVFAYGEVLSRERLITFAIIWVGLSLLVVNSARQLLQQRRARS